MNDPNHCKEDLTSVDINSEGGKEIPQRPPTPISSSDARPSSCVSDLLEGAASMVLAKVAETNHLKVAKDTPCFNALEQPESFKETPSTQSSPPFYNFNVSNSNLDKSVCAEDLSFHSGDNSSNEDFQSASSQDIQIKASEDSSINETLDKTFTSSEGDSKIDATDKAEKLLASALGLATIEELHDSVAAEHAPKKLTVDEILASSIAPVFPRVENVDVNHDLQTGFLKSSKDSEKDTVPITTSCFEAETDEKAVSLSQVEMQLLRDSRHNDLNNINKVNDCASKAALIAESAVQSSYETESVMNKDKISEVLLAEQISHDSVYRVSTAHDDALDDVIQEVSLEEQVNPEKVILTENTGENNSSEKEVGIPKTQNTVIEFGPDNETVQEELPVSDHAKITVLSGDNSNYADEVVSEAIHVFPLEIKNICATIPNEATFVQAQMPVTEALSTDALNPNINVTEPSLSSNLISYKLKANELSMPTFQSSLNSAFSPLANVSTSSTSASSSPPSSSRCSQLRSNNSKKSTCRPSQSTSHPNAPDSKKVRAIMNPLKNKFQLPSVPIFKKTSVPCASPFKLDKTLSAFFPDVHQQTCCRTQLILGPSRRVFPPSSAVEVFSGRELRDFSAQITVRLFDPIERSFSGEQFSGTLRIISDSNGMFHIALFKKNDSGVLECVFQMPISKYTVFRLVTSMTCIVDTLINNRICTFVIRFCNNHASQAFERAILLAKWFMSL